MKNRIAQLRKERRLTQEELAARVAVSRQTIISIERGRFDPSLPLAFRIASVFGMPLEDIFDASEAPALTPRP
ncbi:MAG: helix-turn-helix transcriptional regulator [Microbacterium sp.]